MINIFKVKIVLFVNNPYAMGPGYGVGEGNGYSKVNNTRVAFCDNYKGGGRGCGLNVYHVGSKLTNTYFNYLGGEFNSNLIDNVL